MEHPGTASVGCAVRDGALGSNPTHQGTARALQCPRGTSGAGGKERDSPVGMALQGQREKGKVRDVPGMTPRVTQGAERAGQTLLLAPLGISALGSQLGMGTGLSGQWSLSDSAARHRVGSLGCPERGQDLDWMIPSHPPLAIP